MSISWVKSCCLYFIFFMLSATAYSDCQEPSTPPKIVAFLGQKRVGKDTAADFLVRTYGYKKYALADPIKHAIQGLFDFSDDQLWGNSKEVLDPYWKVTPREVMQYIGMDIIFKELREKFPQIENSVCIHCFEVWQSRHPDDRVVISDLRVQEDLDALKKMGALIIYLVRPGLVSTDHHFSEEVNLVEGYDLTIVNDGTISDFEQKIECAIQDYMRS